MSKIPYHLTGRSPVEYARFEQGNKTVSDQTKKADRIPEWVKPAGLAAAAISVVALGAFAASRSVSSTGTPYAGSYGAPMNATVSTKPIATPVDTPTGLDLTTDPKVDTSTVSNSQNQRVPSPTHSIYGEISAVLCNLGAMVLGPILSGASFDKLTHYVEYTLNKRFGDYTNPKKTLDNKIIITIRSSQDHYYAQNIVLASLVAAISSKVMQNFVSPSFSGFIDGLPLISTAAAPVLFGLFNMISRSSGGHHGRWVEIGDTEINRHGIIRDAVPMTDWNVRFYSGLGAPPLFRPGAFAVDI